MFVLLLLFFLLKIYWNLKIGIKSYGLSRFYLFIYIFIIEFFPLLVYRGIVFAKKKKMTRKTKKSKVDFNFTARTREQDSISFFSGKA